jgi:hypothetical protein
MFTVSHPRFIDATVKNGFTEMGNILQSRIKGGQVGQLPRGAKTPGGAGKRPKEGKKRDKKRKSKNIQKGVKDMGLC